jgi:hypothetical protein
MSRMSGLSRVLIAPIVLTLSLTFSCARRTPDLPSEGATQSSPTPFQSQKSSTADTGLRGFSPTDAFGTGPPFQNSPVLPVGALLTVRLNVPLIAGSISKESFVAVVDQPVVVEGNTLIPREAIVSGRIEAVSTPKVRPDRGYVRLALDSVQIDGVSVPIETASLFARQLPSSDADSDRIRLEKGRRMTFRLKEPIFLRPNTSKTGQ